MGWNFARAGRSHAVIGHVYGKHIWLWKERRRQGQVEMKRPCGRLGSAALPQTPRMPQYPSIKVPFLISVWKLGFCFFSLKETWLIHLASDLSLSCLRCLNDLLAFYASSWFSYSSVKLTQPAGRCSFPVALWLGSKRYLRTAYWMK